PPVCNAGGPYSSTCRTVLINGASASDPDTASFGDTLTFAWTSSNPNVTLSPATALSTTATLSSAVNQCNQSSTLTLTVTDNHGLTCTSTATVTFNDNVNPTIANCPGPVTVQCTSLIPAAATDYVGFSAQGGSASDNCTASASLAVTSADVISGQTCPNK